jgi:phosphohistidine phosphatase
MHRLHLLRHAKASTDDKYEDSARPLAKRGREAARMLGKTLPAALGKVDMVLCSASVRTRETAELALAGFAPQPPILYEEGLYLAGRVTLLRRLRRLDEEVGSVLVIGHNPGLHELALALAQPSARDYRPLAQGKFPTGARASFTVGSTWADLEQSQATLTALATDPER